MNIDWVIRLAVATVVVVVASEVNAELTNWFLVLLILGLVLASPQTVASIIATASPNSNAKR